MKIVKNFNKFSPIGYLNEYYRDIGYENGSLLNFLHQVYKKVRHKKILLEFGGGPTIYQLISASAKVDNIIFSEYSYKNRKEVKKWLENPTKAFNWDKYFEYVLKLEKKIVNKQNLTLIKNRLRVRIKKIIKCDAYKGNPLTPLNFRKFGVVSVCFCPESATGNEDTYFLFMKNISSLLRREGLLVMVLLKNAKYYKVGNLRFPAFPVDEGYVTNLLKGLGYKNIKTESIEAEHHQGYEGMIFLTANKI